MSDDLAVILDRLSAIEQRLAAPDTRWLTIEGAAQYASLSEPSIRRLVSGGKLTAHRAVKGRILIDRLALDALVAGSVTRPRGGRGLARAKCRSRTCGEPQNLEGRGSLQIEMT